MTFDEIAAIAFGAIEDTNRGFVIEKIMALKQETLKKIPISGIK